MRLRLIKYCEICKTNPRKYGDYCAPCYESDNWVVTDDEPNLWQEEDA